MRKPAAFATLARSSPSSQLAWCGSPHAICTTSVPSLARKPCSSGTLLTCNDQLHTPMASGSRAMVRLRGWGSGGRLDHAAERAQLHLVALARLVEGLDLVGLQLGHLLRAGPQHGPAGGVRLEHHLH